MKKIIAILLLVLMLIGFAPLTAIAYADVAYIMDLAAVLTPAQWTILDARARFISAQYGCDIMIFTVNDMAEYGYSDIELFSYYMYTEFGNSENTALLVLSVGDRDYDIRAWGSIGNKAFTTYAIDDLFENYLRIPLRENDYNKAFTEFLDRSEVYLDMAESGRPFSNSNTSGIAPKIIISVVVAFIIALLICLAWRSKMKTAVLARTADNYIPSGGFRLINQGDVYLYRTVTRTKIQSSSSSGSGGSGGGARSGGVGGSTGRSGKY